jgi:hypothetical protein
VRIKVQSFDLLPPASFASYNFGIPVSLDFLVPAVVLANFVSYLAFARFITVSTIPSFKNYLIIFSES